MTSTNIPLVIFESFFNSSIRMMIDWKRLKNEKITITLSVFDELENTSNWYLPWYFNDVEQEVNYLVPNATPLTLADIPKAINRFNSMRQNRIQTLLNEFLNTSQEPAQVIIATYALPNGKHLIMDGNHRSSALILAGVKAKLMVFEMFGPIDTELLPDLSYWKD